MTAPASSPGGRWVTAWPPLLVRETRGSGLSAEGVAAAAACGAPWLVEHTSSLGTLPSLSPAQAHHTITPTPQPQRLIPGCRTTDDASQPNQGQAWDVCRGGRKTPSPIKTSLLDVDRAGLSPGQLKTRLRGELPGE